MSSEPVHAEPLNAPSLDTLYSEDQLDQHEAAIRNDRVNSSAPVAFQGFVDANLNTTFIDPRQMVEVMVRPGRQYSQIVDYLPPNAPGYRQQANQDGTVTVHFLPGQKYRVSRQTLQNNAGVLCTVPECKQIQQIQASPQAQKVQRDIELMRAHTSQVSSVAPEMRSREEQLRKEAAAHATAIERMELQARTAIDSQREARDRATALAKTQQLSTMSPEQFEVYLSDKRARQMRLADTLGEHGKRALLAGIDQDEQDERAKFQAAQSTRGLVRSEAAPSADIMTRAKRLQELLSAGVMTQDAYDRQLQALVGE